MTDAANLDLVVLVPGKDDKAALKTLIECRHKSLAIPRIRHRFLVHPRRDPGCVNEAHNLLATSLSQARYALVVFDYEGCGQEHRKTADEVETDVSNRLFDAGWGGRAATVVIRPELEAWVWSDSPKVDAALGWQDRRPSLREWLAESGHWRPGDLKPRRPKEAMQAALEFVKDSRSSAHFSKLAETVGVQRCSDPAFLRLCGILKQWFGRQAP